MFKLIILLIFIGLASFSKAQTPFFPIFENDEWAYIDFSGKVVLKPKVQASEFQPFFAVNNQSTIKYAIAKDSKTGLYGYLNTNGLWAIPPTFEYAFNFCNGYAVVQTPCDDKCLKEGAGLLNSGYSKIIDITGKVILKDQSQNPAPAARYWFNGSNFNGLLCITQGLSVGELKKLMTPNGIIVSDRFNEYGVRFRSGEWMVTRDINGLTYFNAAGKIVLTMKGFMYGHDFFGGYAKVSKEEGQDENQTTITYFIDKTGKKAVDIPIGFDAYSASDIRSGLYACKKTEDSKYYFLNVQGKIVLGPYDEANRFSNGLAYVKKDNQAYYIDVAGKTIITPENESTYLYDDYQADGYAFLLGENENDGQTEILGVILKNGKVFELKKK